MTANSKPERFRLRELIAMGIGGMIGGGIFAVLGLSVAEAGHAAPVAFAIGGVIALLTGLSYTRLGLAFRSSGGSFTYLEKAFKHRNIAGIGGWLLLTGYIGTMALYAYTFGVYGSVLLGLPDQGSLSQHLLASGVLLVFLAINLRGVTATGNTEDLIVASKLIILVIFSVLGFMYIKPDYLLPVFNTGASGVIMGAALIFVAYEGFELIPNAVNEMEDPERNLGRGIIISIVITTLVYIVVSLVAVGNLLPEEIEKHKEYALAVAAQPALGKSGFVLIGIAALLSTASAINATLFGTARLGKTMAEDRALPCVFALQTPAHPVPWVSLSAITAVTLVFVNAADLTVISSFASSTFLLIFFSINLAAWRLRDTIGIRPLAPLAGCVFSLLSWLTLCAYLWQHNREGLFWMAVFYASTIVAEMLFSARGLWQSRNIR